MITGLCRAYTDYVISLSLEEFETLGIDRHADDEVSREKIYEIIERFDGHWLPGGPAANSIATAKHLGTPAAFLGLTTDDPAGQIFREAFHNQGVIFPTNVITQSEKPSGIVICLVTKEDGERCFLFNKGVVDDLSADDIVGAKDILQQTKFLFASHYFKSEHTFERITQALSLTDNAVLMSSLQLLFPDTPGLPDIAQRHFDHADIIFGNIREWNTVIEAAQEEPIEELAKKWPHKILIQTQGENGSTIYKGNEAIQIPGTKIENLVDTTGAGDAYAGGFLHALYNGKSLEEAGNIGNKAAAHVLTRFGGRPV